MTQPSKDDLRATISELEASVERLREEAKKLRKALKNARKEIACLKTDVEEYEAVVKSHDENESEEVERLRARVETELNGRLKAQARVSELERPGRQAQAVADHEAQEQIGKLKSTINRLREELGNSASIIQKRDDEASRLRAELAKATSRQKEDA